MEIKTLSGIGIEQITNAFNMAVSDYFVSTNLTTGQLQSMMKADRVNLDYSTGAFEGTNLIALILHGTDLIDNKKVVYNGGTGVIPDKRGQGLTKRMYDFILPVLKANDIDYLLLEVITKNVPAIKSYEKVGYKAVKRLKCYRGKISLQNKIKELTIRDLSDYDWMMMQSFWDFTPTWQNSAHAMEALKNINKSVGAYIGSQLTGYIIYDPNSKRVQQIAVHKDFRRKGIASALMSTVTGNADGQLSIVNIDENSVPTNSFLHRIGLENYLDQFEMKLELNPGI